MLCCVVLCCAVLYCCYRSCNLRPDEKLCDSLNLLFCKCYAKRYICVDKANKEFFFTVRIRSDYIKKLFALTEKLNEDNRLKASSICKSTKIDLKKKHRFAFTFVCVLADLVEKL